VELGYDPNGEELEECYRRIIALADESKLVNNRDLLNIAHQVAAQARLSNFSRRQRLGPRQLTKA